MHRHSCSDTGCMAIAHVALSRVDNVLLAGCAYASDDGIGQGFWTVLLTPSVRVCGFYTSIYIRRCQRHTRVVSTLGATASKRALAFSRVKLLDYVAPVADGYWVIERRRIRMGKRLDHCLQ
jgi:hypothetical protein